MAFLQTLRSWLQLIRIPAVPTAISNVMFGYLLSVQLHDVAIHLGELMLLILSSVCLYSSGMVLNDVFDVETDRQQRPERPIPSGRIALRTARIVGFTLLGSGILAAFIAGWWRGVNRLEDILRPTLVAALLAVFIVAYDGWFKRMSVAPIFMGICRLLNVLLGASVVLVVEPSFYESMKFEKPVVAIAIALGIYVTGITLLARKETENYQQRSTLWFAVGLMALGIGGLSISDLLFPFSPAQGRGLAEIFPWLMLLLAFPVIRRSMTAAYSGSAKAVQSAVVSALRTIILLDAALCFLASPERPEYALVVLSLLIPAVFLGKWIHST
jgi:4-hydroxybenzoate polyprenyltransferase